MDITSDTDTAATAPTVSAFTEKVLALRGETFATARQIDDPTTRVRHLIDFADVSGGFHGDGDLLDEVTETARGIENPTERTALLGRIFRSALR